VPSISMVNSTEKPSFIFNGIFMFIIRHGQASYYVLLNRTERQDVSLKTLSKSWRPYNTKAKLIHQDKAS
jgi:hypothetical protein